MKLYKPTSEAGYIDPVDWEEVDLTSPETIEKGAIAIADTLEARNAGGDPWTWDDMNDEAKAERREEALAVLRSVEEGET